ncbi:hypothetical protein JCM11251_005007 [Rhodosporidiobolus azoricus]
MAKSTPRSATKSAAKGTPSSAAPSPAAAAASSASKKRVRVVEGEDSADAAATPASASKKTRSAQLKADEAGEQQDTPSKKGKNGVVLRDLRDKKLDEIETIKSKEQPKAGKGALKKEKEAKGKGKGKAVEQEEEVIELEVEGGEDEDEDAEEEEVDFLAGFESGEDGDDGEDSSDEELEDAEEKEKNAEKTKKLLSQLPKVKGGDKAVEKKVKAKEEKEKKAPKTGTVYLGRIPKGFYEEEMRSYFSQFGEVTRLRLSRNKKTGASKHYAFLEFKYASVAQIVQETMDNYLLAGHILVCKVVPDEQVHPKLWVGANRKFRVVPKGRKELKRREKPKTDAQKETAQKRLLSREDKKRAQLAELGIEYDFAGHAGKKVEGDAAEEEKKNEGEKGTPAKGEKGKKGRKSAGGEEPAKKKPRKSK